MSRHDGVAPWQRAMPALTIWQWALGALCATFVGLAKSGIPGLGILVVPLMVLLVGDARQSAGWLLPLLCVADVFAIVFYGRRTAARRLLALAPWILVGMAVGAMALGLPESTLRPIVGVIVLGMVVARLRSRWRVPSDVPADWHHGARYGIAAGFATTVANAAGPVMNVYLLSKRLDKEDFIAAGAWLFFAINLCKVPIYVSRGMITFPSLAVDAVLVPAVALGSFAGRAIVRRLRQESFERAVLVLTAAASLLLLI